MPPLIALAFAAPALAQYPNKPIKLVVPFIAGSAPDVLARNVGERLSARLGQPIVIENRGGAGGNVGAEYAAKQPADGYTLMLATSSHLINPALYGKVAYDPVKDFAPVALLIRMPSLLIVPERPSRQQRERVDRPREVEAGCDELRLGRQRQPGASRGRHVPFDRRPRRGARAVQRRA